MSPSNSASKTKRPRRRREVLLDVTFYATPTLLQRVEEAMAKTGANTSRSALICQLLEAFATAKGC